LAPLRCGFYGIPLLTAGLSPELPERAISFIEHEHVPGPIFTADWGAYFTFRLFPEYLDYYDSRTIPFGPEVFGRLQYLKSTLPGVEWERGANSYGINAILVSLARGNTFKLREFCDSDAWAPVYLDEASAIFVRRRPELIQNLQIIRCADAQLPAVAPKAGAPGAFQQYESSALVLKSLRRYDEALMAIRKALVIAPGSAFAHVVAGELYDVTGNGDEAEREFRRSAEIQPDAGSETALAVIYQRQGLTDAAIAALHRAIDLAGFRPIPLLKMLAVAEMRAGRPGKALEAIDRAIALSRGEPPAGMLRARETAQRAIAEQNRPPLPTMRR
jgi:tetratricopeptide (TPR) repeat protein